MDVDMALVEGYIADLFNIKETLRGMFKETGNPTLPRIVEMANDVVRRLEDLEWEITKIVVAEV